MDERERRIGHIEEGMSRLWVRIDDEKEHSSLYSLGETDATVWGVGTGPPAIPWCHSKSDLASLGQELEDRGAIPHQWAANFNRHFTVDNGSIIDAAGLSRLAYQRKGTSKRSTYYSPHRGRELINKAREIIHEAAELTETGNPRPGTSTRLRAVEKQLSMLLEAGVP